ncbi:MAG: putative tRNA threonylcarbamoyladenosine biosynthesis protein Gcp [Parcubacteria group bacterium GW2011_GWA2_47_8b]|nr:MAG: putative tRNA threonylcarbamoyladenosine biosynthesis protein Gcp [Parcubacteria group bacterium GW2011_GWA2_47_8b]
MRILAIETSCDDTSLALVECRGRLPAGRQGLKTPRFKVLKNIISSQIKIHRPFGGVVPTLAKREHIKNLPKILQKLKIENLKLKIDAVAVTVGPGLEPALWAGIEFAKELAKKLNKPLIGVNHMEGHLYSNVLKNIRIDFPAIALVVSGGHTILLKMTSLTKWKKLGETRDDAAGEAFDKVARLLGLPYPGGPEIQKLAAEGKPVINFPRPMLREKSYDFSFSGLKTAVLYYLRDNPTASKADVAASFQQAVIDVLVAKSVRAAREYGAESILLCGGVSANKALRMFLQAAAKKLGVGFFVPDFEFNTDNAAMIAAAAYIQKLRGRKNRLIAQSNLTL